MAIHTTLTDVAKRALIYMGKDPIANLEQPVNSQPGATKKNTASVLLAVIHDIIKTEQKRFYWPELEVQAPLSKLSDPTEDVPYFVYSFPPDMIAPIRLRTGARWFNSGSKLHTADQEPVLLYTKYDYTNVADWSVELFNCVWSALASETAFRLTQEVAIEQKCQQKALYYRAEAGMMASRDRESPIQRGQDFDLVQTSTDQQSATRCGGYPFDRIGNAPMQGQVYPGGV